MDVVGTRCSRRMERKILCAVPSPACQRRSGELDFLGTRVVGLLQFLGCCLYPLLKPGLQQKGGSAVTLW